MIYFFVGTSAELVKLAPVIREVRARGLPSFIISSGQNDVRGSELWKLAGVEGADETLFTGAIPPRATGLAAWLARTAITGSLDLRRILRGRRARRGAKAIVHGDTVSTLLGATMFASFGVPVHHVEAGLRSFDMAEPFPEEICRVLVSQIASVAYCPNPWAQGLLARRSIRKVLTGGNTLYDALGLALATPEEEAPLPELPEKFFLLVVHRQENLMGGDLLRRILQEVRSAPGRPKCVFLMHALTRAALEREGLYAELERDPSFVLIPRQPYVTFTKILARAELIVTDGGSNQEECYYLGKPCLLMRRVTERVEGLGENVLLTPEPVGHIAPFLRDHAKWARPRVHLQKSPSAVIADDLARS